MNNLIKHINTNFLRVIAIVMILNSHMDPYYSIKFLATGGMIGNSLFFALSSFGLYQSWKIYKPSFTNWYIKRILRIYPSVWVLSALIIIPFRIINNELEFRSILDIFQDFFYPPFWFIQFIMLLYIVAYWLIKSQFRSTIITAIVGVIIYFLSYLFFIDISTWSIEKPPFRLIFYFLIFIYGLILSRYDSILKPGKFDLIAIFAFIFIIYFSKFLILKNILINLQIVQQMAIFPLIFYSLKFSRCKFVSEFVMGNNIFGKYMNYIAAITLEIFITNNFIGKTIGYMQLEYLNNAFGFVGIVIILSILIKIVSDKIRKIIQVQPGYVE